MLCAKSVGFVDSVVCLVHVPLLVVRNEDVGYCLGNLVIRKTRLNGKASPKRYDADEARHLLRGTMLYDLRVVYEAS